MDQPVWRVAPGSVRVLVFPPSAGLGGWGLRRSFEQEVVVRRDERVGRHHGVGVVDGAVLARADLLRRLGRDREAAAAYERAADMAPTDAERDFLRLGGRASR